jgi:glutamate synthase domain-containing protein 3
METAYDLKQEELAGRVKIERDRVVIQAGGLHYRFLNEKVRELVEEGFKVIELRGVNGQRYLGTGLTNPEVKIHVHGTAGNDLAAFMDGPRVEVFANAQDAVANTMNSGKVIIHGHAGDVLGYGMRGGKLYIRGNVGYRVGIHMKAYDSQTPVLIAGGTAGDFFGEYMAGGILVLLGLERKPEEKIAGSWLGTGIHGGVIYIRGELSKDQIGREVGLTDKIPATEMQELTALLKDYCQEFSLDLKQILQKPFLKLFPLSTRPYGKLYAY